MSLTPQQMDALVSIAQSAVIAERATGCPAELSAAQCILESKWLERSPGNNCFGIKATDSNESYQVTKEFLNGEWKEQVAAFEAYPTLQDCFIAHGRLLTEGKPYADAFEQYREDPNHDLDTLIGAVARRYATDPEYASAVMELAHGPHVIAAIAGARASIAG